MLNRLYQLRSARAVKEAGGGHQVAESFYRPEKPVPPGVAQSGSAAARCKKGSRRLQGVQLELFADIGAEKFTAAQEFTAPQSSLFPPRNEGQSAADSGVKGVGQECPTHTSQPNTKFPPLAPIEDDGDRPLADLFPEAYL